MVEQVQFSFREIILETITQVAEGEKSLKALAADILPWTVMVLLSELGQLSRARGAGGYSSWCCSLQKGEAASQENWAI